MGWSWAEYCALPNDYLDSLYELLKQEERDRKAASKRRA